MDPHGDLTAEDVHNVAFSKPPYGQRGYNEDEVDAFLEIVERRLGDPINVRRPSAVDVAKVVFSKPPIGKRGYDEGEVDAFIAAVIRNLEKADGAVPGHYKLPRTTTPAAQSEPAATFYEAPPLDAKTTRKWWQLW